MLPFFVLLAGAAVFVWLTSLGLPVVVASHFDGAGTANGFMPRSMYVKIMLALVLGAPLLLAVAPYAAIGASGKRLNLPNRDYWLHPERREETIAYLRKHGQWFAGVLAVFLCYVHWLVVRANDLQPPHLSSPAIVSGLVVLMVAAFVWLGVLYGHFRTRA